MINENNILHCFRSHRSICVFFFNLTFIFLLLMSHSLEAQEFISKNFSKNEGLIHSSITHISQNTDGFIILAGDKGYSYFNGENFTHYESMDGDEKIAIVKIIETDDHTSYFLSQSGVLFYTMNTVFQKYPLPVGFDHCFFTSIEKLSDRSLLLGSKDSGLIRIKADSIDVYTSADGLYSDHIKNIYSDKGETYIVTSDGINLFSDELILPLLKNDTLKHSLVYKDIFGIYWSCVEDKGIYRIQCDADHTPRILSNDSYFFQNNNSTDYMESVQNAVCMNFGSDTEFLNIVGDLKQAIWLSTNHGLYRIVQNAYGEIYFFLESPKYAIESLLLDSNSRIWYTVKGLGLFTITKNYFYNYVSENSFPSMNTQLLLLDRYTNYWIADDKHWLGYYSCEFGFRKYPKPKSIGDEKIRSASLYNDDEILFNVGTKVLLLKNSDLSLTEFPIQEIPKQMNVVFVDSKKNVWLGCENEGLWRIGEGQTKKMILTEKDLSVFDLYEDRQQKLWMSTNDGLYTVDNDHLEKAQFKFNSNEIAINAFEEDVHERLWIATSKGAYVIADGIVVDSLNTSNGLISDAIMALYSYDQFMIMGTPDGLLIKSDDQYKYLTTFDGICSNAINGRKILGDNDQLLVSTNSGLSMLGLNDYFKRKLNVSVYLAEYCTNTDTIIMDAPELKTDYFLDFEKGIDFISFSFEQLNLENVISDLHYQLICDQDTLDWIALTKNELFFNKPDVGDYKLIVRSTVTGGNEYSQIVIHYTVTKVFYQRLLFKILLIVCLCCVLILMRRKYRKPRKKNGTKYETSSLSPNDSMRIKDGLDSLLFEKQYYRNPEISLQLLSNELKVTKEYISQVINTQYKSNFNTLINSLRVKEACELLKNNKGKRSNILQIGYYVGFNSKSSFNNAFKKQTGLSPTDYQNKYS